MKTFFQPTGDEPTVRHEESSNQYPECDRIKHGGLSERPMELVLKTSEQKCFVGSNPTASASALQTMQLVLGPANNYGL